MVDRLGPLSLLLLLACGPSVPMSSADTTSTSSATTESPGSTTPTSEGTSSAPADTTSAPTSTSTSDALSTSTTDSSAADPGSTGCQFFCPGDFGPSSPSCDPFAQDCPEGEKCSPYADDGGTSWNNDKCVPIVPDPDLPGEPCTVLDSEVSGVDSCDLGSMCWNVDDGTLIGTCVPLCAGNPETGVCPEPLTCASFNENTLPLCLPRCDPLAPDCPPADTCVANPVGVGFICIPDGSGDEGQPFDPCEFASACDPGLACKEPTVSSECDPNIAGCCTPFCDLNLPPDCPDAMQTCLPYFGMDPAPPGHENVGFCSLP